MTAIAGYVSLGGQNPPEFQCHKMIEGLAEFGGHREAVHSVDNVAFGSSLRLVLPEDEHDRQPLLGGGGRFLLAADARIDNRSELADRLGITSVAAARMSDADMLLAAWERWQLGSFTYLLGDIALAVWDAHDQRLTLARSAVALKPLFYHRGGRFIAFASMPHGFHAIAEISSKPDLDEITAIAAGLAHLGQPTCFAGIKRVRHGHAVEFCRGEEKIVRIWDLDRIERGSIKSLECGEALRAEMDRAVKAQLRRRGGAVAAQLSSGRDSSAVAGTAAQLLQETGEQLIALTGAPSAGFHGGITGDRLADESSLAAETARFHDNITHLICRSRPRSVEAELQRMTKAHAGPMLNMSNLHWYAEVAEEAERRDAAILLIGSSGNFSISAGGIRYLPDLLSQRGLPAWWHESCRFAGLSWRRWRTVANLSLGPFLPESLYRLILRSGGRNPDEGFGVPILRQPYRDRAERLLRDFYSDLRPPRSFDDFRRKMLLRRDNAEKMTEALWGLDVRDPTGDRRLIELCLSFPADQLVSAAAARPAYEAAFEDRIPPAVLHSRRRGVQGADWYELFDVRDVETLFRKYQKNDVVRGLFDFTYIDDQLRNRPRPSPGKPMPYRGELLGPLALASFIDLNFPN